MSGSLLDLVSRRVALRRSGKRHVGRCPLHGPDKHPSFAVWTWRGRERWGCWTCNRSGDAIDWLREVEGLTYHEACVALDGATWKPNPEVLRARREADRRAAYRERVMAAFLARNPDSVAEAWLCGLADERLIAWTGRP